MEKQLNILGNSQEPKIQVESVLKLFTDGASRGNPGASGAGVYIEHNDQEFIAKSYFLGIKTNNQAEYLALALGAYHIKESLSEIEPTKIIITSDSELIIKQMRGEYKVKDKTLQVLKKIVLMLLGDLKCTFKHVLRSENTTADKLANIAVDKKIPLPIKFSDILHKHGILD